MSAFVILMNGTLPFKESHGVSPKGRLEIMSQKKEAWCGETGGLGGEMSTMSFKYPGLLPISSAPLHLPHAGHSLGDSHTASHLTVMTTLRDGHFFHPHYADKETEARVLLPKSTELIRGRAGTQTKLGKSTI